MNESISAFQGIGTFFLPIELVGFALKLSWWFEPNPRTLDEDDIRAIFAKALA